MFHIFDSLVKPILVYGSDVWGVNSASGIAVDKVFMNFMKHILGVKMTTSNIMTIGECGRAPPSVYCNINTLCYLNRLEKMQPTSIAKQVYWELSKLHDLGFKTWATKAWELVRKYEVDIEHDINKFKSHCKNTVLAKYISTWKTSANDIVKNPVLRTYTIIKGNFKTETYLDAVKEFKYRNAISKLRTSSHVLEIERGRHARPPVPKDDRLCPFCDVIDDEEHFIMNCTSNTTERLQLFTLIHSQDDTFNLLGMRNKFIYIFQIEDRHLLTCLGKFIYNSFKKRNHAVQAHRDGLR